MKKPEKKRAAKQSTRTKVTARSSKKEEAKKNGRPRKYQSVAQLRDAIDSYFEDTKKLAVTGLALHLGFTSRQALINNEGYSPKFLDAIKRAKLRIECYYEEHLVESHAAGSIFALKNFGWKDTHEFEHRIKSVDKPLTEEEIIERMKAIKKAGDGLDKKSIDGGSDK